jgi:hypothetical protein
LPKTARRFSAADAESLAELHQQGMSAGKIARTLGFSVPTVTAHARKAGLQFGASRTDAATVVHMATAREKRAAAILENLDLARRARDQLASGMVPYRMITQRGEVIEGAGRAVPEDWERIARAVASLESSSARLAMIDGDSQAESAGRQFSFAITALRAEYTQRYESAGA